MLLPLLFVLSDSALVTASEPFAVHDPASTTGTSKDPLVDLERPTDRAKAAAIRVLSQRVSAAVGLIAATPPSNVLVVDFEAAVRNGYTQ